MTRLQSRGIPTETRKIVRYSYLDRQFAGPAALRTLFEGVESVVKSGQFTLGKEVERFEAFLAARCGARFAVGVASGTDALILAMRACGIGDGDEVITAPNSFIATAGAIAQTRARPVFVDVREDYTIDPAQIVGRITPRTRAIIPVHLTGLPADMDPILDIANRHRLHVIEDASQAIDAVYRGRPSGSLGVAAAFSFHPLKNLNGWGDGGAVTTNSEEIAEQLRLWRNHGLVNRDECAFFALNSRLDSIQAALLLKLAENMDDVTEKRIRNAALYDHLLSDLQPFVTIPPRREDVRQVFHTYVLQVKFRETLIPFLSDRGVETKVHYPIPIHLQEAARHLGYRRGDFPVSERQAGAILSLPIHQYLEEDEIRYVADQIRQFYSNCALPS
ncbi:DegT/DnrJ/EryC1/StrS family aminotransferase [bacterium]|nr:DegT/DnrJ/EryC1/StrS family aminotransferase [bacterium]